MTDEKPDITAVLEHYGTRVNGGRRSQMVACPLHEDRTPSCSVDFDRNLYNCHSCGSKGDSYNLIMEKEDVNFVRARALAATLGFATGGAGGGADDLSGGYRFQRRAVSQGARNRPRGGGYKPAWRRG